MQSWFAVVTKPRAEAIAFDNLQRQGYTCLWPRVRRSLRDAKGMRERVECLFPNYLFLRADPETESLAPVRSTRGALGLVRFGSLPARVPEAVIEQIRARLDPGDGTVRLDAPTWAPGTKVRISEGPLSGIAAIFLAEEAGDRVRMLIELLGTAREVVLPRLQVAARI
ncbi:transcription termination/antitermination NusG family protein [Thermomonas sp.]|uniref:transcription termination/antitermination NusG family protein n=1 Tax=Thermomonas sp. TaxID=1971895 RepID=UPI002D1D7D1C|nr:transcription termination/antitermination NusG family protein [Thermomonas sp.]HRO63187.1 transcription termination/antitermination NusG family protein [Thermomonas sp.]